MIEKRFAFHLFHSRDDSENYYTQREKNRSLFQRRMGATFEITSISNVLAAPPLIGPFFDLCREMERNSEDYFASFDARPGHVVRSDRFHRMIRKLTRGLRC